MRQLLTEKSIDEKISEAEASEILGISVQDIQRLKAQGVNLSTRNAVAKIGVNPDASSISQEAAQMGIQIQRETVLILFRLRRVFKYAGRIIIGYFVIVIIFAFAFMISPIETARLLGYVKNIVNNTQQSSDGTSAQVLGVETSSPGRSSAPLYQRVLQPISRISLDIVKALSPEAYGEISKVTILDPNEILEVNANGEIKPIVPIELPSSSFLKIPDTEQITNLNSQLLQGKEPGVEIGDIAIVGENALSNISPTDGNILSGDGTQWVSLSAVDIINDNVPIVNAGIGLSQVMNPGVPETLTINLNNSPVVAGSYGNPNTIPTYIVDAQGRLTSAADTPISGLNVSNFSSSNISQWGNDSGYTTSSSTTTFTNKTIDAGSNTITGLTNSNLSGSAGISNANLANSSLSILSGAGLVNGGLIPLGGSTTLDVGAGDGIIVNADGVGINLTAAGTTGLTSSNSGLEVSGAGVTLLHGCTDNQILKWTDAGGWACSADSAGSDTQHVAAYDTSEAMTNVTATQVTLGTVSITPTTATGDIYLSGQADVYSSNGADQPFNLRIETTNNCTGTTVGNANVTYTITSGASAVNDKGSLIVSGIVIDAGAFLQSYSLCASTSAGDSDVLNWRIEALVIDTGADLAEIYTSHDGSLSPGDVVSFDSTLKTGVKKSSNKYDPGMLGIISTLPGQVMGSVEKEGVIALPVALSGRVPVKVSTENGEIVPGDYLTSSSISGVAMKATASGPIIGMALDKFDGAVIGTVLTFIKNTTIGDSGDNSSVDLPDVGKSLEDLFKGAVEFFGKVIFNEDVTFAGHVNLNKDTAGHATVKLGESEVSINFEKEYVTNPTVTSSINLHGDDDMNKLPAYAIYDVSTKGFKIKLSEAASSDFEFSWIALQTH